MNKHESINYLEFPAKDFGETKSFFSTVFGWFFIDYGTEYIAISGAGIDGGFYKSDLNMTASSGSALVVFYSEKLEATQEKITNSGGLITQKVFDFPGGRRFHFSDPNGNEFAVWSDK